MKTNEQKNTSQVPPEVNSDFQRNAQVSIPPAEAPSSDTGENVRQRGIDRDGYLDAGETQRSRQVDSGDRDNISRGLLLGIILGSLIGVTLFAFYILTQWEWLGDRTDRVTPVPAPTQPQTEPTQPQIIERETIIEREVPVREQPAGDRAQPQPETPVAPPPAQEAPPPETPAAPTAPANTDTDVPESEVQQPPTDAAPVAPTEDLNREAQPSEVAPTEELDGEAQPSEVAPT
ncbi:hypothetical protein, partial [Phormidium sp. CCY1219]|uniref:hypothetical protein n=1 Tax=Phormidium sp. CCY1219 TaxID=2886104 RepID=UPI002D1F9294